MPGRGFGTFEPLEAVKDCLMSDIEIASAGQLAEDRLKLASDVQRLRDEVVSTNDDTIRAEKAADLESALEKFNNCDRQYMTALALDNANRTIEALSRRPNRAQPVAKAATLDRATGNILDAGELVSPGTSFAEALMSPEYSKAFESLVMARGRLDHVNSRHHRNMLEQYGKGGDNSLAFNEVFIPYAKTMTIGSSTNGSNIVAPDFRFDIITARTVTPLAMRLCRVISTNVSAVTFPRNTDTNTDSGRVGTVGTDNRPNKGEQPSNTSADTGPFDQLTITARTGTMVQDVSADLFQDAPGFSAYLQQESSKLFAARIDKEVFSNTTLSTSCEAILANGNITTVASGTSAAMGANDATIYDKLSDTYFSFKESYSQNLSWVMRRATYGRLTKVKDSSNMPLVYQYMPGGPSGSPMQSLFGAPVNFAEYMPATGAANATAVLVGDFNEYILLMRQGFTVIIDDMSQQASNNIRLNYKYRIGGAVRDPKAFATLKESVS
jgi:HK97 family phage major capsid protein